MAVRRRKARASAGERPGAISRARDSSHCQLHVSRACSRTTRWVAEEAQCRLARFVLGHAGGTILGDLLVEVEAQLVVRVGSAGLRRKSVLEQSCANGRA